MSVPPEEWKPTFVVSHVNGGSEFAAMKLSWVGKLRVVRDDGEVVLEGTLPGEVGWAIERGHTYRLLFKPD